MRVEAPRVAEVPGGVAWTYPVAWEGPAPGPTSLTFEVDVAFADDFRPGAASALLALLPVAATYGEPRLRVEGAI
jgi:hypothetical protein